MLPEDWKKEIEQSIDKAEARNAERDEAQIASQNTIATPLNRLIHELNGYRSEQKETENGKRRREWAGLFGVYLSAFLVFITAVIFYCQLRTFQSTDAATHELVDNGVQTAERQLRAYVGVTARDVPNLILNQKQNVGVFLTNYGQTPALKVQYWGDVRIKENPLKSELPSLTFRSDVIPINPDQKVPVVFETNEALEELDKTLIEHDQKRIIYGYGVVKYLDVFGKRRITTYRFEYGGQRLIGLHALAVSSEGNDEQ